MRKGIFTLLPILFCILQAWPQNKWDKPMQLKNCSIDVKADMFTATTFMEMEFYNFNNQEMEGLFRFELKPGQVITAFQLDLSGKYRDGSIEEKWKATNAYNTIVGKRIDPALLTMESPGQYSLRIYPVPGKGTRKVTMTVQQVLKAENSQLHYYFPLNIADPVEKFKLSVNVFSQGNSPVVNKGLIGGQSFQKLSDKYSITWNTNNILLKNPIAFFIPVPAASIVCTKPEGGKTHFAARLKPSIPQNYELQPKHLAVFWDASASGTKRDSKKEISFLRQFIAYHGITQLTITSFNHRILDKVIFEIPNSASSRWIQYLQGVKYSGATQLGAIDMTGINADMFMLFSDGNNTFGKSLPVIGAALLYAVHASPNPNSSSLNEIVGSNGGKVIDLNKKSTSEAIYLNSTAENWLLYVSSSAGKTIVEQGFPQRVENMQLINGTVNTGIDTLYFHYGNNNIVNHIEKLVIGNQQDCSGSGIDRITMLEKFENVIRGYNWENILDFGLTEKVVTLNTAYIVLERMEDYVKYNIAPPNDLKEECEKINYVKKDTRIQRQQVKQADEFDILYGVVNSYNLRLNRWDNAEAPIALSRVEFYKYKMMTTEEKPAANLVIGNNTSTALNGNISSDFLSNEMPAGDLKEVVVVGNATAKRSAYTGASAYISSREIMPFQSVEAALQGRVSGLLVTSTPSNFGNPGEIRIRGARSLGVAGQPLFVLDGIPVSDNINNYITTTEIENITILKDAAATALYGSRGANGVVVITSKRGKANAGYVNRPYRLKDMPDVEYLEVIKEAVGDEKNEVYRQLKEQHSDDPAFYLDMAQHFFEEKMPVEAMDILMEAAEVSNGSFQVLRAVGYILESNKQFKDAINVYEQLLEDYPDNIYSHRDLAWAYYQDGQYQKAVDILFNAIKRDTRQAEWTNLPLKTMMLTELNAMISIHKNELDISAIPSLLIRPMAVDLRIILDCNKGTLSGISVKEPGGETCSHAKPATKSGGMFTTNNAYWQNNIPGEYQVKKAQNGKYKIGLNYYDYHSYPGKVPAYVRIVTFRNFGKSGQSIRVENVVMDNQYGEVEIGEVKW